MNTDRVQAQFKRSHQSVNIHAISGITTRDGTGSKTEDPQEIVKSRLRGNWIKRDLEEIEKKAGYALSIDLAGSEHAPPYRDLRTAT